MTTITYDENDEASCGEALGRVVRDALTSYVNGRTDEETGRRIGPGAVVTGVRDYVKEDEEFGDLEWLVISYRRRNGEEGEYEDPAYSLSEFVRDCMRRADRKGRK